MRSIYFLTIGIYTKAFQETVVGFQRDKIYNRSYQEAMNRPISLISYDSSEYKVKRIKLIDKNTITKKSNFPDHNRRAFK